MRERNWIILFWLALAINPVPSVKRDDGASPRSRTQFSTLLLQRAGDVVTPALQGQRLAASWLTKRASRSPIFPPSVLVLPFPVQIGAEVNRWDWLSSLMTLKNAGWQQLWYRGPQIYWGWKIYYFLVTIQRGSFACFHFLFSVSACLFFTKQWMKKNQGRLPLMCLQYSWLPLGPETPWSLSTVLIKS